MIEESIPVSGSDMQPLVGIIIVHPTGGYAHSVLCLKTLRDITYKSAKIIVVDNGSTDGSGELLHNEFPELIYIRNETNEGFAKGNNIGTIEALSQGCEHILLLNNDTIVTPSFLEPLVERLLSNTKIGSVSGKIYYYPPTVGGREKIIWYAGATQKWHMAYSHNGEFQVDAGQFDVASETIYSSGCLMLLQGNVVKQIGGLSEEYFMYWEESDWCMRSFAIGYTAWYEPRSVIYHNVRSSMPGKETKLYIYMQFRNFLIFAHNYFHGISKVKFWLFFPLHILNRIRISIQANNYGAIPIIFQGIKDYFKGFRGKQGVMERNLLYKTPSVS